jgi:hypothetical protein
LNSSPPEGTAKQEAHSSIFLSLGSWSLRLPCTVSLVTVASEYLSSVEHITNKRYVLSVLARTANNNTAF